MSPNRALIAAGGLLLVGIAVLILHYTGPAYEESGVIGGGRYYLSVAEEGVFGLRWARRVYLVVGAAFSACGVLFSLVWAFFRQENAH